MDFLCVNELGLWESLVGVASKLEIAPAVVQSSVIPAALAGREITASAETLFVEALEE